MAAVQLPQLRLALQPTSGLPVMDLSAQNLRRLLADVDAALEADRIQREALRAALDETHQLRDSLVGRSAIMDVSLDRSADDISLQSSFSTRPDPRAQRILQLEQHVQLLTDRLRERERERLIEQRGAHARRVAHAGTQTETAKKEQEVSGAVYNKQAVQIVQLEAQLKEERGQRAELAAELQTCQRRLATTEEQAAAEAKRLDAALHDCRCRLRELEAERGIADSHKESLLSALRHERSLFGFALARLERHGIDTSQLTAMQKQYAQDLSPLASVPSLGMSAIPVLQPGRGDETPTGSTPRQLEDAPQAATGSGNRSEAVLVIAGGTSVGTPPGSPIARNETRSVTPDDLSDGPHDYNSF